LQKKKETKMRHGIEQYPHEEKPNNIDNNIFICPILIYKSSR